MNTEPTVYPSKVDVWLGALMISAPVLLLGLGCYIVMTRGIEGAFYMGMGVFVGVIMAGVAIPCRYTLTDRSLIIQAGLIREEIPYEKIKGATLSSNPLSAPALSLLRVRVELQQGYRLISPLLREKFIEDLENRRKPLALHSK